MADPIFKLYKNKFASENKENFLTKKIIDMCEQCFVASIIMNTKSERHFCAICAAYSWFNRRLCLPVQ